MPFHCSFMLLLMVGFNKTISEDCIHKNLFRNVFGKTYRPRRTKEASLYRVAMMYEKRTFSFRRSKRFREKKAPSLQSDV
jgi:hypothetical protein